MAIGSLTAIAWSSSRLRFPFMCLLWQQGPAIASDGKSRSEPGQTQVIGQSSCPQTANLHYLCWLLLPAAVTMPAQSPPGSPGSPGYMPSTLSTSRKLRPTAVTRTPTS